MSAFQIVLVMFGMAMYVAIGGYVGGLCSAEARRQCVRCKSKPAQAAAFKKAMDEYNMAKERAYNSAGRWPRMPNHSDYISDCSSAHNASAWGIVWPFLALAALVCVVVCVPLFFAGKTIGKAAMPAGRGIAKLWTSPEALGTSYYARKEKRRVKMQEIR